MGNVVGVILLLLVIIGLFYNYLKNKKMYYELPIIIGFITIYIRTPYARGISKTNENILFGAVVILAIISFYSLLKNNKEDIW
ncbi:hypothetical protein LGL08_00270 [Clostridium estertheticum]|uniref:hypothetical protein n=1 Tax=Clostridium estertheticum TaxID=238834 RepID=UPI001CF23DC2|nr:hypothetical protein [Clostridium estertheticum]MCB2305648.1 hypothetical protein [Clostridium estertheticum]MCB2344537.1 hypothetical protein [Clostridium estertheticum]MCB2348003.1 hypothetical protein [Clostridium estertheticum]WAG45649.1 hypothetical protein LL127_19360 [Clostridium estertheticum]